jgi:hypothetical protein
MSRLQQEGVELHQIMSALLRDKDSNSERLVEAVHEQEEEERE